MTQYTVIPTSLLNKLNRLADKMLKDDSKPKEWLTSKEMLERFGLKKEQLRYLRNKHPQIYTCRGGDKTSVTGKAVRSGIRYNVEEYNKLHARGDMQL